MAQVSEPSANPQNFLNPLQSRRPDAGEGTAERPQDNEETGRTREPDAGEETRRTRTAEEQILLERETQDTGRSEDSPRSNRVSAAERNENERGAAQVIENLEEDNARGVRGFEEAAVDVEPADASRRERQTRIETQENAASAQVQREAAQSEASRADDRAGAQESLREFETRDQERIEPQQVSETVREQGDRAAQEARDREPAVETQRVVQAGPTGLEPQTRSEETVSSGDGQIDESAEAPDPASVQTERGQNIDDLI